MGCQCPNQQGDKAQDDYSRFIDLGKAYYLIFTIN